MVRVGKPVRCVHCGKDIIMEPASQTWCHVEDGYFGTTVCVPRFATPPHDWGLLDGCKPRRFSSAACSRGTKTCELEHSDGTVEQ